MTLNLNDPGNFSWYVVIQPGSEVKFKFKSSSHVILTYNNFLLNLTRDNVDIYSDYDGTAVESHLKRIPSSLSSFHVPTGDVIHGIKRMLKDYHVQPVDGKTYRFDPYILKREF